eukprot:CAMPEP_0202968538 /NCGR_PEP_ID=MMETSP1396-20130829/13885_1 /ASSEMBLY_ACC=CAM_ASM_000872 /TAXON_ID= /ORGANISM="Pseudokeronopsis sp., Strain Brazil" /LENGTH=106 /DNA_ID=CAMNT_0049694967 /DNA_START=33 /DNA_END=353 /DNA_ORIENTATION=-
MSGGVLLVTVGQDDQVHVQMILTVVLGSVETHYSASVIWELFYFLRKKILANSHHVLEQAYIALCWFKMREVFNVSIRYTLSMVNPSELLVREDSNFLIFVEDNIL